MHDLRLRSPTELACKSDNRLVTITIFKSRIPWIRTQVRIMGIKSIKSRSFVKIGRFRYHKCLHSVDLGNGLRNDVCRCANGFLCPLGFLLSG